MIKVGQVWRQENNEIFVVTFIEKHDNNAFILYADGYSSSCRIDGGYNHDFVFDRPIAEYPTWQEAVNSPEFRGEK